MKINIRFIAMPLIAFVLAFSATGIQPASVRADSIIYVNRYAGGANDGSSWSNAFNKLQDALDAAASGDQIWVSWGVYYPDEGLNQTNGDRNSTFTLKDGVEVYGGFEGTEALLSERDIDANPVILSGDIDENDVNTDTNHIAETTADIVGSNSYHVVFGGDATATTILDGFIITAGDADGLNFDNSSGGGLFNWGTSPTLNNLTFSGNYGYSGGGMYNYNTATPALNNVVFSGNQADSGGGMSNAFATPTMTNVTFEDNTANFGGGVYNSVSSPTLENTTFLDNTAVSYGGGMFNTSGSHATLTGVTFTGNGSTNTGGGVYNSQSNPIFTNVTFDNNTAQTGGGLTNSQSNPTLTNVTFTNNSATISGGGILNSTNSNTNLANVTFSNNSAVNNGGGFYSGDNSAATFTNVTFSGNSAGFDGGGGGIFALSSTITLKNTIIANSTWGDCNLSSSTIGVGSLNNLIESTGANACGLTNGVDSNIIGSDPALGGLTGSPAYFSLNAGSPAIDAGSNAVCAAAPVNNESQNGLTRPQGATCDIGSYELLNTIPTSATFGDVPMSHPYWLDIEILYANGYTAGCSTSPLLFCPDQTMNRGQSAVFIMRGNFGSSYLPPEPPYATAFADNWSPGTWAQKWAQGMLQEGLTAGCSVSGPLLYCPWDLTPRLQAAVFGMRLQEGNAYVPPAATGTVFADITDSSLWYAKWAEAAYANGLIPACGTQGGKPLFCPNSIVSRGLGAYMIVRAKNLSMP